MSMYNYYKYCSNCNAVLLQVLQFLLGVMTLPGEPGSPERQCYIILHDEAYLPNLAAGKLDTGVSKKSLACPLFKTFSLKS